MNAAPSTGPRAEPLPASGEPRPSSRPGLAGDLFATVCATAVLASLLLYHLPQVGDDAYIYLRYARHALAGHGPVFNEGEWVEGFSSWVWLGWMVLLGQLGVDPMEGARWTGRALALLLPAALGWAGRQLGVPDGPRRTVIVVSALWSSWSWWAGAGLETAFWGLLLLVAGTGAVRGRWQGWLPYIPLVVAGRPEGAIVALVLLGVAIAAGERRWRAAVAVVIACIVAVTSFRMALYGVPLPNTYYAKAGGPLLPRLEAGLLYAGPTLGIAVALGAAGAGAAGWAALRGPFGRLLLLSVLLTGVVLGGGGDWMSRKRLLVPVLPLLMLAAAAFPRRTDMKPLLPHLLTVGVVGALLVPPGVLLGALRGERLPLEAREEGGLVSAQIAAAERIRERRPDRPVLAVGHAGALPAVLWDFEAIDMVGLSDAYIAQEVPGGMHLKWDADYVLSRSPDIVVLNQRVKPGTNGRFYHPGYWGGETALVEHPAFKEHFRPWDEVFPWRYERLPGVTSYVVIFERVAPGEAAVPEPGSRGER